MGDIYDNKRRLERALYQLEDLNYSEKELEIFKEFKEHLRSTGTGNRRVNRYLLSFVNLESYIDFDLLDLEKKKLKLLVGKLNNNNIEG